MPVPLGQNARLEWNIEFERKLSILYPEQGPVESVFTTNPSFLRTAKLSIRSGAVAQEIAVRMRELCVLQRDISAKGIKYLGGYDLETSWVGTPETKRQETAREALYLSCGINGFEDFRTFCPELTASNLSCNFIPLLKTFVSEGNAKREEDPPYETPIHFDSDKFDQYMRPHPRDRDELEPFIRLRRIYRTYCISLTIWYMLLTFASISLHQPQESQF